MIKLLLVFTILSTLSCGKLSPKKIKQEDEQTGNVTNQLSRYMLDGQGGLFNNIKWYSYDSKTHLILSNFDVYALRSDNQYYRLQILNYYANNDRSKSGNFTLRLQKQGGSLENIEFNAAPCGNAFTNPNYRDCAKNKQKYVYSYVDLNTKSVKQMTDKQAQSDLNWHIAFRGKDIKLNSGKSGSGDVVGALAYRFSDRLNEDGTIDFEKLKQRTAKQGGLNAFIKANQFVTYSYFPQDGIDRVIYETYWHKQSLRDGTRSARPDNWWIVRSQEGDSYFRFNVTSIVDQNIRGKFNTAITFKYTLQSQGQVSFSDEELYWQLPSFLQNAQVLCLDFDRQRVLSCAADSSIWDIKLVVDNSKKNRVWQIFTNNGAIGPMSKEAAFLIKDGR